VAIRTTNFEILPAILPIDDVTLTSVAEVNSSEDPRKLRQLSYRGAFILLDLIHNYSGTNEFSSSFSVCGAGVIPPSSLQPIEAYYA
jgi:hypothetical protein